jgi:hypothetical protein
MSKVEDQTDSRSHRRNNAASITNPTRTSQSESTRPRSPKPKQNPEPKLKQNPN